MLATNDMILLDGVMQFLSKQFDMKDMGIGIKIYTDRSQCVLGLSQETYTNQNS